MTQKTRIALHMETSDPDDALALALLATHPLAELECVTIHPGGADQVGIVRHILSRLGKSRVSVGAGHVKDERPRVSAFHYGWLGAVEPATADAPAADVLRAHAQGAPDLHLVTGAALTGPAEALSADPDLRIARWTCQGGFVGDNLMPEELRLPKFAGRLTCPSFNVNGDPKAALWLFGSGQIPEKRLVTKSVCHGIFYDRASDEKVPRGAHAGLDLLKDGMQVYFRKHPGGKALHDVVAAVLALRPELGQWVPAVPYRENGEWGCRAPVPEEATGAPQAVVQVDIDGLLSGMAA